MSKADDLRELNESLSNWDRENHPQRRKHRLPISSYADGECVFFLTMCARHQGEPFVDEALARSVVDSLLWSKRRYNWMLYCYCLMLDHLHVVAKLPAHELKPTHAGGRGVVPEGVLEQIGRFKRYTTTQIWWKHGGTGRLWQTSSYDRILRFYESAEDTVYYVLNNPVRKGLVTRWEDYPFCGIVDPW